MSSISLAFPMGSPADVDATYEKVVAAGYHGPTATLGKEAGQQKALCDPPARRAPRSPPLGGRPSNTTSRLANTYRLIGTRSGEPDWALPGVRFSSRR
jgi:hypothetical protein